MLTRHTNKLSDFGFRDSIGLRRSDFGFGNRWKRATICLLSLVALCQPALAKLNVVATTPDLAAIAREIGGDHITLTTLAKPTEDPHFVDAKPSFIVKLNH